jgi:cytochrome c biogenesis protein CcdA
VATVRKAGRDRAFQPATAAHPYDFLTVQAKKYDESSAQLAADVVESAQQLVRLEIALAKQEVKELAVRNGIAIGALAVAGVFALLALLVALPVLLIVWIDNHTLVAIIWLALYLLIAAGLALFGRFRLQLTPPQKTIRSLKETREWALRQISSNGK